MLTEYFIKIEVSAKFGRLHLMVLQAVKVTARGGANSVKLQINLK